VLFSSHILQEVEAICERALILSKGQIVANDSLANLLSNKLQSFESVFRSLTSVSETRINA
jgi:ABC-2 type transport system ATP-binding protein